MLRLSLVAGLGALSGVTLAQFPPTPSGVTVLESQIEEGIRISYKEVLGTSIATVALANSVFRTTSVKPPKVSNTYQQSVTDYRSIPNHD